MKLARLRTSLTMAAALACALFAGEAHGQAPPADFVVKASPFEASPFATVEQTPHFTLGYDDLWGEYRGAEFEQDWPAARARGAEGPRRWPLLSVLGRWLDGLFAPLPRHRRHARCQDCDLAWAAPPLLLDDGLEAVKFPEIPVPVPLSDEGAEPAAEQPVVPAQPIVPVQPVVPEQPIVPEQPLVPKHPPLVPTAPAAPIEQAAPIEPAAPLEPAAPVPVEREPAAQPVLPKKPPANTIPPRRAIEPAPVEPAPIEPAPIESQPIEPHPIAPEPSEPKRGELGPTFPPVVELAPEPVIPGQPAAQPPTAHPPSTLPPRNRIPPPQERVPKNRLPRLPYNPMAR
jgi:hypothetical protein